MAVPKRLLWLPAIAGLLTWTVVLAAQDQPFVDNSMRELIAEVKALRQTVERSAGATRAAARAQLLISRLQLQENRLDDLRRRLEDTIQRAGSAPPDEARRLQADAQSLRDALTAEQSRWSDYNARLDAIERDFAQTGGQQD